MKIKLVEITEDNKKALIEMAIAAYTGKKCRYCGHVYSTVEDILKRKVVFAGVGQLACGACFQSNNPK